MFHRLMASSDPFITLQAKILHKKKCKLTKEMKKLLVLNETPINSQSNTEDSEDSDYETDE